MGGLFGKQQSEAQAQIHEKEVTFPAFYYSHEHGRSDSQQGMSTVVKRSLISMVCFSSAILAVVGFGRYIVGMTVVCKWLRL